MNTKALLEELADLKTRLREAEDTLEAIRSGAVDAIVVTGKSGEQVYTLQGTDEPYRLLIESINEGTITISMDGIILYSNKQFADMLGYPLEKIVGSSLLNYFSQEDQHHIEQHLHKRIKKVHRFQTQLIARESLKVPVQITMGISNAFENTTLTAVITDLSEQNRYQKILQEEKLSQSIMENSPDGIAVCNMEGVVIRASKNLSQFCGESALMKPFDQVFHIEISRPNLTPELFTSGSILAGKTLRNSEANLYHSGTGIRDITLNAIPLLDDKHAVIACLITLTDVTAQKQAEAIRDQQERFLNGINRIFREVIISETEEDLGRACLEVAESLTGSKIGFIGEIKSDNRLYDITISNPGWKACQMIDKAGHQRIPGSLAIRGLYGRVLKDGRTLLENNPLSHPDWIGIPKGHPPLTAFLGVPLIQAGHVFGLIAVGNRDGGYKPDQQQILEMLAPVVLQSILKKRTELALKASEARFRAFFENAGVGTAELAANGQFLHVNKRMCQMTGYSSEELQRMTLIDLFPPEDTDENQKILNNYLQETSSILEMEWRCKQKNGNIIWIKITTATLDQENGESFHLAAVFADITERKKMEAELSRQKDNLEAANKDLESFSYSVSHDLRTPLRAVDGFSRILLSKMADKLNADEKRQFEVIRNSTQEMSLLIDQLLSFSRLGRQSMTFTKINMLGLIKEVWAELQTVTPNRRIMLEIHNSPPVFGDRALIKQVLVNLLSNAVKFTGKQETPVIEIGGESTNMETIFFVRDNGVGFDMDYSEKH